MTQFLRADFNGLFGDLLCVSHSDTAADRNGNPVPLAAGMAVTAFDDDIDEHGQPDALLATGLLEQAPGWLACKGSRWVLRINSRGVHHESDL